MSKIELTPIIRARITAAIEMADLTASKECNVLHSHIAWQYISAHIKLLTEERDREGAMRHLLQMGIRSLHTTDCLDSHLPAAQCLHSNPEDRCKGCYARWLVSLTEVPTTWPGDRADED